MQIVCSLASWTISRPGCQIYLCLFGVESVNDTSLILDPNIRSIILQLEYPNGYGVMSRESVNRCQSGILAILYKYVLDQAFQLQTV